MNDCFAGKWAVAEVQVHHEQCGLTAPGNLGEIAQEVRELRDVNELENAG